MDSRGRDYARFVAGFLLLMVGGFLVYAGAFFYQWNEAKQANDAAREQLSDVLKKIQAEDYNAAMSDTYGGKTPQETLQLYIDAVEKGDYILASKYFIGDNQAKELQSLSGTSQKNIMDYISLLNVTMKSAGTYSSNKTEYLISKPMSVDFLLYPSGVWKIAGI